MKAKIQNKLEFWQKQYRPRLGLLKKGDHVVLAVDSAIQSDERPVIVTQKPGDVAITGVTPNTVEVKNMVDRSVPFMLVIVPVDMIAIGMVPWREVLTHMPQIIKNVRARDVAQVLLSAIVRGTP